MDGLNRFAGINESGSSDVVSQYYYPSGQRYAIGWAGSVTANVYDPAGRLTTLINDVHGSDHDATWTFDRNAASQIASATRTNDAYAWTGHYGAARAYTTNGLNQYREVASTTAAGQGVASFTYDRNGNLVTTPGPNGQTIAYSYDIENRLTGTSTGLTLNYDPLGRLYQSSGGPSGTTRFLYDGDALVVEYNGAGAVQRRYVHGGGVDQPLLWYDGAALTPASRRQLLADAHGSIVAVTDWLGHGLFINRYDEYGIPAAANQGRFQYTGQIWLPDLGMYHYKARVYSPFLGRFLQNDPVGYEDQINLYAYVRNDPVNNTDPTGEAVRVAQQSNNVQMEYSIAYYGVGNAAAVRDKFARGLIQYWGGRTGRFNVQVTVRSYTYRPGTQPSPGYAERNRQMNFVSVPLGNHPALTVAGRFGTWPAGRPGWTGAHEGGHFAGLQDRYYPDGTIEPGYEDSIMAVPGTHASERDIEDLLRANPGNLGPQSEPQKPDRGMDYHEMTTTRSRIRQQ